MDREQDMRAVFVEDLPPLWDRIAEEVLARAWGVLPHRTDGSDDVVELVNSEANSDLSPECAPEEAKEGDEEDEEEEVGLIRCADCGALFSLDTRDTHYNSNDGIICDSCAENYSCCDQCGNIVNNGDLFSILDQEGDTTEEICSRCFDRGDYFTCDDCEDNYPRNLLTLGDGDMNICQHCEGDWRECGECGEIHHIDNVEWSDSRGGWFCRHCYDDVRNEENGGRSLHSYSYKPLPLFHKTEDETSPMYMGVELEIDSGYQRSDCVDDLAEAQGDEDVLYLKEDGSLRSEGIEIVTHPCTLSYHLQQFPWERVSQVARSYGYKSHNTSTCGLHVHVSRNALGEDVPVREATIAKIILMVDRFWDKLSVFSRRDLDNSRWATKPNAGIDANDTMPTAVAKAKNTSSSRYRAVNLQNSSTIEFRIFKGTLKVSTIKATLQFVSNICHFALQHTLECCLDAQWEDVVLYEHYPELSEYLRDRHLVKVSDDAEEPLSEPFTIDSSEDDSSENWQEGA